MGPINRNQKQRKKEEEEEDAVFQSNYDLVCSKLTFENRDNTFVSAAVLCHEF